MNLDSQHSLLGYAFITLAERTDSLVVGTARKIQSLFYLPFPFNPYFPVIPIGYTFPPPSPSGVSVAPSLVVTPDLKHPSSIPLYT